MSGYSQFLYKPFSRKKLKSLCISISRQTSINICRCLNRIFHGKTNLCPIVILFFIIENLPNLFVGRFYIFLIEHSCFPFHGFLFSANKSSTISLFQRNKDLLLSNNHNPQRFDPHCHIDLCLPCLGCKPLSLINL